MDIMNTSNDGTNLKHQYNKHLVHLAQEPRTPEQAKELIFSHWEQLDRLCTRRFPKNENLAHEGLLFVIEQLEANRWKRIRAWEGSGRFMSFLITLASRLLTDFTRRKFGHIRMPKWLSDINDPLWNMAYQILIKERHHRHEAVYILEMKQPWQGRWVIEEVIGTILARCQHPNSYASEAKVSIENCADLESMGSSPETEFSVDHSELMDALCLLLGLHNNTIVTSTHQIRKLALRLKPHINLTEKDRRLLQLRLVDGIKMKNIALQLDLAESPYRRYHKILQSLRNSCRQAGLWERE